jgi:hypothetical protein
MPEKQLKRFSETFGFYKPDHESQPESVYTKTEE